MIEFSKLPSLRYVRDIKQICEPLFKSFDINYYDYARFYKNGRCIILFSNPDWVEVFLNKDYVPPVYVIPAGLNPWNSYINLELLSFAAKEFKHNTGVTFFNRTEDYDEIVNIATHANNPFIENFCVNHEAFINQFSHYFQDKASNIIQKMEKESIIIKPNQNNEIITYEKQFDDFFNAINPKDSNDFFKSNKQSLHLARLTSREKECMQYFIKGISAKRIAREMNISYRTVEKHIHNIKNKFNCTRSMELMSLL